MHPLNAQTRTNFPKTPITHHAHAECGRQHTNMTKQTRGATFKHSSIHMNAFSILARALLRSVPCSWPCPRLAPILEQTKKGT